MKRSRTFCTAEQKARVAGKSCIVCGREGVVPAHVIDKSLAPSAGGDERAVVPLCRWCHTDYDDHELDLSPYLEPAWRDSVAWAVEAVGLWKTVRRVTGADWVEKAA
jgi:hypothetical protein